MNYSKQSMERYEPDKIEKKWREIWEKESFWQAKDFLKKPKKYLLVEFPYPSGAGLHVGHCRSYTAFDIIARKKRMEGFNVLFPMGWDAFGLPTENYAIKTGLHPREVTLQNTAFFKEQEKRLGFSFDWTREVDTTSPSYYKWTQWIFLQLFKKGLAYKVKMPINWCPACKIGLANEEVVEDRCERCGEKVVKKEKEQWLLKITNYADRLIDDLKLVDYPEKVKILQKDWIGKSEGTEVEFKIPACAKASAVAKAMADKSAGRQNLEFKIPVFTTRIDTIFGATYLVLAPEHPIIEQLKPKISNIKAIERYIEEAKNKSERERISQIKEKTGIKLEGVAALNPATKKEIPIFIADYVLAHYGTGAIMAVPAHDSRDLDFAKKYNLPIIEVIKQTSAKRKNVEEVPIVVSGGTFEKAFEGEGILMNSGKFDGLDSKTAKERILDFFNKKGLAEKKIYYKLRDWIFSRQRYWGEPIPLVFCEKCGWQAVKESELPVELPSIVNYKPTETGDSPLVGISDWVNVKCPKCQSPAKRETDVMPNWAGSNWYYLRYCDPKNDKELAQKELLKYWLPVDWYNGGMEHTTLHLLYSRFIYKFLWDIGAVPKSLGSEPYKKRTAHGMILGEGGIKMSKSKGNVINPEDIVKEYGADTLRIYEMFIGPFDQAIAWDQKGVKGARRFLEKTWSAFNGFLFLKNKKPSPKLKLLLGKTAKKVSEDIENLKFNTAVSALMEFVNAWQKEKGGLSEKDAGIFLKIISPFAPHLAEELYHKLNKDKKESIFRESWPKTDSLGEEKEIVLILQVNGKLRGSLKTERGISEKKAKEIVYESEKIKKWLEGREIKKIVFVKDKLINFVV